MTGQNYSLLFFCSLRDLSPFSSLAINSSTLRNSGVKQQPPLHTKVFLALSSQDSLLVFRKTGGVAMKGKELVDLIVLGVHDNDHQCSAASIEFTTFADRQSNLPPCRRMRKGGHYSLVNNVSPDIIH